MITMVDKNSILLRYFRDGESMSSISRSLRLSRTTVTKYVNAHKELLSSGKVRDALCFGLSRSPLYDSSNRSKRRLTTEICLLIKECLLANEKKRSSGLHKQLMKNIDIHEYLLEKGLQISYSSVCQYIQCVRESTKEAFIKQSYKAGVSCEFDWGHVRLDINGKSQSLQMAVFTSCYSNYRWAKLFYRQDTLAFMQSHVDFFRHTNGVYRELIYDNMRVAVARFTGSTEERATTSLLELSNYYKFGFRFCNVRKANEKGHVERSVEYIRRKAFCRAEHFDSLEDANAFLANKCEVLNNKSQRLKSSETAVSLFKEEFSYLYPISADYACFTEDYAKVDSYATITLYGNRYSVPDTLVGKLLNVRVFAEHIEAYLDNHKVCSHPRSYGSNVWNLNIDHYLRTLLKKPGALKGSIAFNSLDAKVKQVYHTYFEACSKEFVELLHHCKKHQIAFTQIENAIKLLEDMDIQTITKDNVLTMVDKQTEKPSINTTTSKESQEIEQYAVSNLKQLNRLMNQIQ